ncbi:MAG TPA: glycosyltransferase family 4 protein [Solirubrobacteraceae bacterium]|nr:glycosyltransferase family 4 protein [Solirubrobacteraceae bacterium]
MNRDLLVTSHTPTLGSGRALRTYGIVRALAQRGPLDLLYPLFGSTEASPEYRQLDQVRLWPVKPSRGPRRALAYAAARARGVPAGFARGVSPELARRATALTAEPDRGWVIADGPTVAAALMGLARRRPVIYNAHNVESAFRGQLDSSRGGLDDQPALERFERRLLGVMEEAWMASEADIERARELAPATRLRYVPNVVDVEAITPVAPDGGADQRTALFVADFSYEPNRRALAFLVEEVMPGVWEQLADAHLTVVGRGAPPVLLGDPRVQAAGFVADLDAMYATAACVVVPLLQGGGSPLKFIEAMAHGVPVLGTSVATAGLAGVAGKHYLRADGPERFAATLVGVLKAGAPEIGAAGRQLAESHYSISALSERLRR